MHRPLRVKRTKLPDGTDAYASDGAPSDCVTLALLGFIGHHIDLVISGINPNANIGHDVTYSGTVTAAMEAVIRGIPGIAVSVDSPENHLGILQYGPAASYTRRIAKNLLQAGFPSDTVINVNVPYLKADQIKGIRITRQGLRVYRERLDRRRDPRGRDYFWIGGEAPGGVPEKGTDYGAMKAGYVSITPLQLDLTHYPALKTLRCYEWS
jgi:5'-nucleotidase